MCTFAGPLLVIVMITPEPQPWPSPAVLMAWWLPSTYERWVMWASVFCTVPAGVLGLLFGLRTWLTWAPCIALSAAACFAAVPGLQSHLRIEPQRIVATHRWPERRTIVATTEDLAAVEVACTIRRSSRRSWAMEIPALIYVIHLRDGTSLSLLDGLGDQYSASAVSRWLEIVEAVDRSPLIRGVARFNPEGSEGGWCLPRMREELTPAAARVAERLLASADQRQAP